MLARSWRIECLAEGREPVFRRLFAGQSLRKPG